MSVFVGERIQTIIGKKWDSYPLKNNLVEFIIELIQSQPNHLPILDYLIQYKIIKTDLSELLDTYYKWDRSKFVLALINCSKMYPKNSDRIHHKYNSALLYMRFNSPNFNTNKNNKSDDELMQEFINAL